MSEFIPKQYQYIATTIRLSSHKLDLINSMAAKHNISRNEFINQCIDFALEHMRDVSEPGVFYAGQIV